MSSTRVCVVPSNAELLKVDKGGLWGGRLTVGTVDDCVILVGCGNNIWSKLKAQRAAVAVFGELDHDGRRVRSGGYFMFRIKALVIRHMKIETFASGTSKLMKKSIEIPESVFVLLFG
uniref:Uncharacterized protein n=1 Tax=Romanomermis culicivorax TaxID=13658 RepID=A0A915KGJ7_ROMCU